MKLSAEHWWKIISSEYEGHRRKAHLLSPPPLFLCPSERHAQKNNTAVSYYKWPTDPVHNVQAGRNTDPHTHTHTHTHTMKRQSHLLKLLLCAQMQTERKKNHFLVVSLGKKSRKIWSWRKSKVFSSPAGLPTSHTSMTTEPPTTPADYWSVTVSQLHQITPICHFCAVKVNHPLTFYHSKCLHLNKCPQ